MMKKFISYIFNTEKSDNYESSEVVIPEEVEEQNFYTYQEEIWRKIGILQVIFAVELLRIGKLERYISRVTGLSLKEVKKIKDMLEGYGMND